MCVCQDAYSFLNRVKVSSDSEYVAPFIGLCWVRKFRYLVQWKFFFQSGCQSGLLWTNVRFIRGWNVVVLDGVVKSPP